MPEITNDEMGEGTLPPDAETLEDHRNPRRRRSRDAEPTEVGILVDPEPRHALDKLVLQQSVTADIETALRAIETREQLEVVNRHSAAKLEALVGTEVEILCEGASRHNADRLSGRTRTNKIVIFEGAPRHVGQIFPVKITRASGSTLYGDPAILE